MHPAAHWKTRIRQTWAAQREALSNAQRTQAIVPIEHRATPAPRSYSDASTQTSNLSSACSCQYARIGTQPPPPPTAQIGNSSVLTAPGSSKRKAPAPLRSGPPKKKARSSPSNPLARPLVSTSSRRKAPAPVLSSAPPTLSFAPLTRPAAPGSSEREIAQIYQASNTHGGRAWKPFGSCIPTDLNDREEFSLPSWLDDGWEDRVLMWLRRDPRLMVHKDEPRDASPGATSELDPPPEPPGGYKHGPPSDFAGDDEHDVHMPGVSMGEDSEVILEAAV
jgi:hypothetical protein